MKKILFIDRDGTLIKEPADEQIDSLEKLELCENVIPALLELKKIGYRFVMVSNQDGLGTESFPEADFHGPQEKMLGLLKSQGIEFDEVLICPHLPKDNCLCRKPHLGLVRAYLGNMDQGNSYVIGDRESDLDLAKNMGIPGILFKNDWLRISSELIRQPRKAKVERSTKETSISVEVNLDGNGKYEISTGIHFLDHMLEQLSKHSGMDLTLKAEGDLQVDTHHIIEDTALTLGSAIKQALGDKVGIERYGFVLPMDETKASVSLDLSGRPYFKFKGEFKTEKVGELPLEMVPHFFHSLSQSLSATLHMEVEGENSHHMVESMFKAFARTLRLTMAKTFISTGLPSTKGAL